MRYTALQCLVPSPEEFVASPPESPRLWSMPAGPLVALLGLPDVDTIVRAGLPAAKVHVVHEGQLVDPARYTWSRRADDTGFGGQVRATALARLLRDGATLVVQSLQHNYRPVADFCARLEHETGQVLFAEAFLTPGDRPGLEAHHDEENVLIVQTVGSKTWRLHRPMVEQPLQHETYGSLGLDAAAKQRIADTEPDLDVTLRPGDVLWVPRGWLHRGQATGTTSLHITFGFPVLTRFWLAQRITRELARQGAAFGPLRQELPWNTATHRRRLTAACGDVVQDVRDALGHLDPAELAAAFADEHLRGRTQPDASVPVTAGLQPDVELHTPVRLVREAVRGTVSPPDGGLRLYLRDQSVVLQGPVVPWLERHLGREDDAPVTAAELVPELEAGTAVAAVSRFVRMGLLRPLTPADTRDLPTATP